jgi:hypothetical protein
MGYEILMDFSGTRRSPDVFIVLKIRREKTPAIESRKYTHQVRRPRPSL